MNEAANIRAGYGFTPPIKIKVGNIAPYTISDIHLKFFQQVITVQKLWLKDFERNISPKVADKGEQLLQAGAVRSLREVEKHFWVAQVDDEDGPAEVEVIITPHKIKAFTCECWSEGRKLMCPHIAATLLKVRQYLEKKEAEKQARQEAKVHSGSGRFTIQHVLEKVPPEELAEFIREYARRDRDFNLAFKTRFAGLANTGSGNPFSVLIDSVLPKPENIDNLRETDFRRLKKTVGSLSQQIKGALEQGNFSLAFQIATVLLEKLTPVFHRFADTHREALNNDRHQALEALRAIGQAAPSPELREQIPDFLLHLFEIAPVAGNIDAGMTALLAAQAGREEIFGKIKALYEKTPLPAPGHILQLFLSALAQRKLPEAVVKVLEDYTRQSGAIAEAIYQLADARLSDAALAAGEYYLDKSVFNPHERRHLEERLAGIAGSNPGSPWSIRFLQKRFLSSGKTEQLEPLKKAAGDQWENVRQTLLLQLRERNDTPAIAAVLAADGEWTILAALLETSGDLSLLRRFEERLLHHDKAFLKKQYVELLSAYLREHFGKPAAASVREKLAGLVHRGEKNLVRDIVQELIAAFPDRPSLPEELQEITGNGVKLFVNN